MAASKRTEYQTTIKQYIEGLLNARPDYSNFLAGGRLRLKFTGIFLAPVNNGDWSMMRRYLSRKAEIALKRLMKKDSEIEVYNSNDKTGANYSSWAAGITIVIPPQRGKKLTKRSRTKRQTEFIVGLARIKDQLNSDPKLNQDTKLQQPEFIGFNKSNYEDKNIYIIWRCTNVRYEYKDDMDADDEEILGPDYSTRTSNFLMSLILDWAEENGGEVRFSQHSMKTQNYMKVQTIPGMPLHNRLAVIISP